ncbi:hypothetical protein BDV96DRAFT_589240 [Lophiotrema nucula]|uniref:Uncharacterized protein n=1 Tax=Lophiotrema nucula TaxID=690887 RepID=A0A6A5YL25_9PLEO|nr:hypothetical protein BDV96DRAFT_589240 [Lophiotrema nucula]
MILGWGSSSRGAIIRDVRVLDAVRNVGFASVPRLELLWAATCFLHCTDLLTRLEPDSRMSRFGSVSDDCLRRLTWYLPGTRIMNMELSVSRLSDQKRLHSPRAVQREQLTRVICSESTEYSAAGRQSRVQRLQVYCHLTFDKKVRRCPARCAVKCQFQSALHQRAAPTHLS